MIREKMISELVDYWLDNPTALEQFIRDTYKNYTDLQLLEEYRDYLEEMER